MPEFEPILQAARKLLALGEPAMFATLVGTVGSSYRPAGAHMLAGVGVPILGGISGGCLEDYVAREGLAIAGRNERAVLSFDTTHDPDDPKPVPGCGGQLHVLVERLSGEHVDMLEAVAAARAKDRVCLVRTEVWGFEAGRTRVVRSVGGPGEKGGATEGVSPGGDLHGRDARDTTPAAWDSQGRNFPAVTWQTRRADDHWVIERVVVPPVRLVVLGAGDDCMALVRQGKLLGWHVTVVDRRIKLATRERLAGADVILAGPWESELVKVKRSGRSAIVVMTHSVPDDAAVLPWAVDQPGVYLGLLGPASRREVVLAEIAARGIALQVPAKLRSPIGLDLGEKSPEAIALAVAAEILAATNGRPAMPLSEAR